MKEFQRKKKIRIWLYSRLTLAVLLALTFFVARGVWGVYVKERGSARELERAEEELAALLARREALEEDIARLESPEGMEAEIRGQFQVAKSGEKMVVVVEEKRGDADVVPDQRSFLSRLSGLLNLFR